MSGAIDACSILFMPDLDQQLDDAWILGRRGPKNDVDPNVPYAHLVEKEFSPRGVCEDVATIFLTNRECPYRCLMCDLWKNTTDTRVAVGQIPRQIRYALDRLPATRHIKLYNSGNFFDPNAIPPEDDTEIAEFVADVETIVVESHPNMIGRRCYAFNDITEPDVHVAMGLETVHPEVLSKLNKRMTLDDFGRAVAKLRERNMQARAFILLRPPFLTEDEGVSWAKKSVDFAFDVGVECCAVIPTRGGNGAIEALQRSGQFATPAPESLEEVLRHGLSLNQGRVFADLWDLQYLQHGTAKQRQRYDRLIRMNLTQRIVDTNEHEPSGT